MEEVQTEILGEPLACLDAADAVALCVEARRKDAETELSGQHGHDPAAHAALRRHAHVVDPTARKVVHPAGAHDAQHLFDITRLQCHDPGDRIHPVVGQTSADHRQISSRHQDGALPKIQVDHLLGRAIEDPVAEQEVRDRPIAVAGVAFGAIDRLVDLHRPAGVASEGFENPLHRRGIGLALDQARGRDGARIDHRVHRTPGAGLQADRVERLARGLDSNLAQHLIEPAIFKRQAVGDRLRNRLNGKALTRVADLVDMPVDRDHRDPQPGWIGPRQLRDVIGDGAVVQIEQLLMDTVEVTLNRRELEGPLIHLDS